MSEILFGQSYFLHFDPSQERAMQPYPPLGTLYAAARVRQEGFEVALFDAMLAASEDEWGAALDRVRPRIAVIYEDNFNYLSKMCLLNMRLAAFKMIAMAHERGCLTIVAGSDASDHAAAYLEQGADYVIIGEGEQTLAELLRALPAHGETLSTAAAAAIPGLAFKNGSGSTGVGRSAPRPPLARLDDLPFPAWDLVDVERYRRLWRAHHGYYSMNMVTTRGCPYHCNWCAKPIWGQRYHSRSPANVVREMAWLQDQYRPDHIWFADDIMGLKPGWWPEFAALVEAHQVQIPFKCLLRADLVVRNPDNVAALARAGGDFVWLGAESGSQPILEAMEKGITVDQIREATNLLQAAGIRVGFFLQFGYPGEGLADIEKTLQMVRECRPDDIGVSVSYPLPGTRFYESVRRQLGPKKNWDDSADLAMMYRGPFTTPFYRQLHRALHREFRLRRGWAGLRQVIFRPARWRSAHLRAAAAVVYRGLALPLDRLKLRRLARVPGAGLLPLAPMSPAAAARPTPQVDLFGEGSGGHE